ncbi:hypothetical protein AC1031_021194 [Aphanomyces cochlioides]|nr:hypothetical protein AC1031_021194 [Aphanomyces cochlioides]
MFGLHPAFMAEVFPRKKNVDYLQYPSTLALRRSLSVDAGLDHPVSFTTLSTVASVEPLPPSPTHAPHAAVSSDHESANHENVSTGQTFAPSSLAQHLFPATIPPTEEHTPPDAERRITLSTIYSIPYAPEIYREGPFSDPSVTANTAKPAAEVKATANPAVDQAYAHFDTAQKYQALPNQPNPPLFDGVTAAEKKKSCANTNIIGIIWFRCKIWDSNLSLCLSETASPTTVGV